jgi:hypothetical protein
MKTGAIRMSDNPAHTTSGASSKAAPSQRRERERERERAAGSCHS